MFGGGQAALAGAGGSSPAELIGTMPSGGAEAIASGHQVPDDELLDRAAIELGRD